MAEFSEVMRNAQRRCKLCGRGEKIGCTLGGLICGFLSGMPHDADWNALEKEVMRWAAENPEPVYPTWAEYLMHTYQDVSYARILGETIPADIAEKLGIEPKEG